MLSVGRRVIEGIGKVTGIIQSALDIMRRSGSMTSNRVISEVHYI